MLNTSPESTLTRTDGRRPSCGPVLLGTLVLAAAMPAWAAKKEKGSRTPMDIAYGSDYTPDPVQLARLTLGGPEVIEYIGEETPPPGRVIGACDFQGNDFSTLYCLDRENSDPDDSTNLYTIDTETAEMTHLASLPLTGIDPNEGVNGLTYDPTTGRMFAVACDGTSDNTNNLYELDVQALTLTQIGESSPPGVPYLRAVGADNEGRLWAVDSRMNGLQSINKETGELTFVGPFGFDIAFGQGMDFDASDGTCYLFLYNNNTSRGELHRCDTATGHTELVGVLGQDSPGSGHWGTGGIAAPGPCHVSVELASSEAQAGDEVTVHIGIVHNRAETVTVSFVISIEDAAGRKVASHKSEPRTMSVGDHFERDVKVPLPSTLSPGAYTVSVSIAEMEQGTARASAPLTVSATSFD